MSAMQSTRLRATALAGILLGALALGACGEPADAPSASVAAQPEATPSPRQPLTEEQQVQVAQGRQIAVQNCAGCHALDNDTQSPRADAPPMQDLLARYDSEALADDLIEGIKLGHEDMPQFDFTVIAADALVAYLRSIRPDTAPAGE
jgi:mono/diheme cytochrome c family protein